MSYLQKVQKLRFEILEEINKVNLYLQNLKINIKKYKIPRKKLYKTLIIRKKYQLLRAYFRIRKQNKLLKTYLLSEIKKTKYLKRKYILKLSTINDILLKI